MEGRSFIQTAFSEVFNSQSPRCTWGWSCDIPPLTVSVTNGCAVSEGKKQGSEHRQRFWAVVVFLFCPKRFSLNPLCSSDSGGSQTINVKGIFSLLMRLILTQTRFSNARVCHRFLTRPPAAPQRLQQPQLRPLVERSAGGKQPVPSASRSGRASCPHPRGARARHDPHRPHSAPLPSPTRRRRPPLRRYPDTSQGSWLGEEAPCRTAWRRCGGGGSVS